jgi:hypothetical protein
MNESIGNTALRGVREIREFTRRSWGTIETWIRKQKFPARQINGVWESDKALITKWKHDQIKKGKTEEI